MTCTLTQTSELLHSSPGLTPGDAIFEAYPIMTKIRNELEKSEGINFSVLLRGQGGSGTEVFGKLIHSQFSMGSEPLVKVSCPAIPSTLIKTELICYEKGAFTGADGTKSGRIELARRGTLFLDEIGESDPFLRATGSSAE
jgi:two-component system response regulator AtoC